MNHFWTGFEKQAGLFDRLRSWWGRLRTPKPAPVAEAPAPTERKPPKYFYSKKFDQNHVKNLNRSIRANARNQGQTVTLHYTKANGEETTRKITPYTARGGNVIVGFDHKRGAVRSFRVDRIRKMEP